MPEYGLTHVLFLTLGALSVSKGPYAAAQPVGCHHAAAAVTRAEAMLRSAANVPAVAFSRQGGAELGEFEDTEVLKTVGDVPDDLRFLT